MPENIPYTLKRYRRSKHMRIIIHQDGRVVVTSPMRVSKTEIERFVSDKQDWIQQHLKGFVTSEEQKPVDIKLIKADYLKNKGKALALMKSRVEFFNKVYNYPYNKIFIKNQKTCWGSCSSKGNLNFNYKILFLTKEQQDYIVVHELCHLAELNHSPKFWALVAKTIPDYKNIKKELNKTGIVL